VAEENFWKRARRCCKKAWDELWTESGWWQRSAEPPPKKPDDNLSASEPLPAKKTLSLSVGGATATVEGICGCDRGSSGGDASGEGDNGAKKETGGISTTVLKVVAWAATGITATGFIAVVGAALFWIRFNEVGLPATQAVGLLARSELLVQGAQVTIIDVAIALVAVLLVFFVDPEGRVVRVSLLLLGFLALLGILYVLQADLTGFVQLVLCVVAVLLLAGVIVVGLRTDGKFWPLALGVFVATMIYSAATGLLIVDQQSYVQAVAVLRSGTDAGLTGIYVTANNEKLYLGRLSSIAADKASGTDRRAMFDVSRSGATYAVGPLESVGHAEARAQVMLEQLIQQRERDPGSPATAPKSSAGEATGSTESAQGRASGLAGTKPVQSTPETVETVAKAFGSAVTVQHKVAGKWTCLVRYAAAGSSLLGHWWTSCDDDRRLGGKSMLEIRDDLALPGRFQPAFDMKVVGHLAKGSSIIYLEGRIGSQCEHEKPAPCGYSYPGGGEQIYLPEPQKVEMPTAQCTATRQDEPPQWVVCEP
jgi:hypothetical protein